MNILLIIFSGLPSAQADNQGYVRIHILSWLFCAENLQCAPNSKAKWIKHCLVVPFTMITFTVVFCCVLDAWSSAQ